MRIFSQHLLLLLLLTCCACTRLFFYPQRELVRHPSDIGLSYTDVFLPTTDGLTLHGWYLPAEGKPWSTVIFAHGNAENISTHLLNVFWLPAAGIEVYLFDYRGFGKSEGRPGIKGAHDDVESMIAHVVQQKEAPACQVLYGQSLGAALSLGALELSPHRAAIDAIIVDSGFADFRAIAEEKLGAIWLTRWGKGVFSRWFASDYSPRRSIASLVTKPVLITHGSADQIVPLHHGLQLFSAARQPKELWLIEGGRHGDLFSRKSYRQRFLLYLHSICRGLIEQKLAATR